MRWGGEEKGKTSIATGICFAHSVCGGTDTVSSISVSDFIHLSTFILLVS